MGGGVPLPGNTTSYPKNLRWLFEVESRARIANIQTRRLCARCLLIFSTRFLR